MDDIEFSGGYADNPCKLQTRNKNHVRNLKGGFRPGADSLQTALYGNYIPEPLFTFFLSGPRILKFFFRKGKMLFIFVIAYSGVLKKALALRRDY